MTFRSHASVVALAASLGLATAVSASAQDWSLETAAEPYSGTTVDVVFLKRPGYAAAKEMIPEFTEKTGIEINITELPYENALGQQVRDFVAQGDLDIALIDLVWIGNFAANNWIVRQTSSFRIRRSRILHSTWTISFPWCWMPSAPGTIRSTACRSTTTPG